MANPIRGEAKVTLADGRVLQIVYDLNAWIDLEQQLGMKLPEIMETLKDKDNPPGLAFQRALFWAGLQKHHSEMTIRDAGEVMLEAAEPMAAAMEGGFPVEDDAEAGEAEADPPKPPRGTGTKPNQRGRA